MKYFAAVVDCASFTEAAARCFISQSAISQQIQSLERELGVELLDRRNRRFELTAAGEYFYSRCKVILILEFPQNYPHWEKLLRPVIHNFQKMPKI